MQTKTRSKTIEEAYGGMCNGMPWATVNCNENPCPGEKLNVMNSKSVTKLFIKLNPFHGEL